jgi:protein-S-isoprenylcysteine O-methyltransferase Ste14
MKSALENRIPPPIVVIFVGALMWLTARFTTHWLTPASWRIVPAAGLFIVALAIGASGFMAFRRAKTTIDPVNLQAASVLVTGGIFRFSRNPMYVGFVGLLTAWAIYLAAPWTLSGVAAFVLFIRRFQIVPEERVITEKFGATYVDYQRRVRRWL